jgi:ABC-2 type transport system ATP-binding protein
VVRFAADAARRKMHAMSNGFLCLEGIAKSYGDVRALTGVTCTIAEGELFGLLGPNGAGKSTLMAILSCLSEPSSGQALLDGRKLQTRDLEIRRRIGLVPQDLAIYNELTARENLRFFGELYGVREPLLTQRVAETLASIGLADRADQRAEVFSGGMKRRLNLGAALIHHPSLILLDEPTVGVDPQSRNHIFEEVRRLNQAGATIVYTTHYMEEVEALCTRIAILDHGNLIACDSLDGLLKRLRGSIRIRGSGFSADFRDQLGRLGEVRVVERDSEWIDLESADVRGLVPRLLALVTDWQVDLTHLVIQEPNLERVFLDLTGRALRD